MKHNDNKNIFLNILGIIFMIMGGICLFFTIFEKYFESFDSIVSYLPFIGAVLFIIGNKLYDKIKVDKNEDYQTKLEEEKTICRICGKENDNDTRFCINCGRNLLKECEKCKTINSLDSRFCKNCGERL